MCLKESFRPFSRDALNFWPPKIYVALHCPAVFRCPSPSAVITAPCDATFNIPLYHSAQLPLMLTGKGKSAQITR